MTTRNFVLFENLQNKFTVNHKKYIKHIKIKINT